MEMTSLQLQTRLKYCTCLSTTIGWMVIKISTNINVPQSMNPTDSGEPLILPLAPWVHQVSQILARSPWRQISMILRKNSENSGDPLIINYNGDHGKFSMLAFKLWPAKVIIAQSTTVGVSEFFPRGKKYLIVLFQWGGNGWKLILFMIQPSLMAMTFIDTKRLRMWIQQEKISLAGLVLKA